MPVINGEMKLVKQFLSKRNRAYSTDRKLTAGKTKEILNQYQTVSIDGSNCHNTSRVMSEKNVETISLDVT
jgi:hypothetical protein